jgi:hypothetical protein
MTWFRRSSERECTTEATLLVSALFTAVELPPYCASPQVSTELAGVSAAKANPFLGL